MAQNLWVISPPKVWLVFTFCKKRRAEQCECVCAKAWNVKMLITWKLHNLGLSHSRLWGDNWLIAAQWKSRSKTLTSLTGAQHHAANRSKLRLTVRCLRFDAMCLFKVRVARIYLAEARYLNYHKLMAWAQSSGFVLKQQIEPVVYWEMK